MLDSLEKQGPVFAYTYTIQAYDFIQIIQVLNSFLNLGLLLNLYSKLTIEMRATVCTKIPSDQGIPKHNEWTSDKMLCFQRENNKLAHSSIDKVCFIWKLMCIHMYMYTRA